MEITFSIFVPLSAGIGSAKVNGKLAEVGNCLYAGKLHERITRQVVDVLNLPDTVTLCLAVNVGSLIKCSCIEAAYQAIVGVVAR